MIKNQWYAVLSTHEVPATGLLGVMRLGEKLAFWRDQTGNVACIIDQCCHRGASISAGRIIDGHAQCPFHGFEYDATGKVKVIPANGRVAPVPNQYRVKSYPTRELYGLIWIFWGDEKDCQTEPQIFDEIKEGFFYSEFTDHWPMHYTRCIENQMDVVHVPFVHHNTIGRSGKTIVYGPKVEWNGQELTWYVQNVMDDGKTKAKSANEMGDTSDFFSLKIIMPNIWLNIISDKLRIFAAFAPIDHENTMIYLRFYQSFMPLWGIRHLVGFFGNISSRIILKQDKRVVVTQTPKISSMKMGENLIPGDRPIIEFRRRRDELQKANPIE